MRLVMAGGTRHVRVWLEAETPEEAAALQACAGRGEWTNGRGLDAVPRLHALAARLGFPVQAPTRPPSPGAPCLVVVRRGERDVYDGLLAIVRDSVGVIWDRRTAERRTTHHAPPTERRREDRRQPPPTTWTAGGFLVVPIDAPPP